MLDAASELVAAVPDPAAQTTDLPVAPLGDLVDPATDSVPATPATPADSLCGDAGTQGARAAKPKPGNACVARRLDFPAYEGVTKQFGKTVDGGGLFGCDVKPAAAGGPTLIDRVAHVCLQYAKPLPLGVAGPAQFKTRRCRNKFQPGKTDQYAFVQTYLRGRRDWRTRGRLTVTAVYDAGKIIPVPFIGRSPFGYSRDVRLDERDY